MKAQFQHLGFDNKPEALRCYWVKAPHFGFHWHYHPEIEITYVHKGHGIRLVGDNVNYFEAGDFVFLGSDLPHTWISDDDFNKKTDQMEVIVLQFLPTLFSEDWLNMTEMKNIRRLLQSAKRGLRFSPERRELAAQKLRAITHLEGFERFSKILDLLNFLGQEEAFDFLASKAYIPPLNNQTEQRLLRVCQYIHDAFTRPIKLSEVAQLANMNASAFCRFFKKSTGQSLSEYISDLRIGKACNLLLGNPDMSIAEVAYKSGFSSQTLFNRSFLKKKDMTPSSFRKMRKG
jgi:AraC-like DNA-binding protein/quercetin dioxygenase-like cupin family protein